MQEMERNIIFHTTSSERIYFERNVEILFLATAQNMIAQFTAIIMAGIIYIASSVILLCREMKDRAISKRGLELY